MLHVLPQKRPIEGAIEVSRRLADEVERLGRPVCTASVFEDTVTILGALQVETRLLVESIDVSAARRRSTSGTAAHFPRGGVVVSVGLPTLDWVFRDASAGTVLNRNLRLFLAGFAHAGLPAAYFGREWLALRRDPIGLVGLDVRRSGAILLEVWSSLEGSFALPRQACTDLERACDRYRGRVPVDIGKAAADPLRFATRVVEGIAERMGVGLERHELATGFEDAPPLELLGAEDVIEAPLAIPVGFLDVARGPRGTFVGGDLLGPVHALGFAASTAPRDLPLIGASWNDVARAISKR